MRNAILTLAATVGVASLAVGVEGECIGMSPAQLKQRAALVFDGTVVKLELVDPTSDLEHKATIEVARVWKGTVRKKLTTYFVQNLDGPVVKTGTRYIFF